MRATFFLLAIAISCTLTASGVFRINHGPYLCNPSEGEISIVWSTNRPAVSWIELAPDDSTHFYSQQREMIPVARAGRILATETLHHIRLNNLQQGKRYRYRVISREVTSWKDKANIVYGNTVSTDVYLGKPLSFRIPSPTDSLIRFLMLNDVHGRGTTLNELCKNVNLKTLDLIILNGDMSSYIDSAAQIYTDFLDAVVRLSGSRIPIVYVRGNHEARGRYADELYRFFPTSEGNYYHTFRTGPVNWLAIDCGEDKPDTDIEYKGLAWFDSYRLQQARWIETIVYRNKFAEAPFRIVLSHMPFIANANDSWHGIKHLQATTLPLLNKAGVHLMLSGHTHRYAYYPAHSGQAAFPILVNDHVSYLTGTINSSSIEIEIGNANGIIHKKVISKK